MSKEISSIVKNIKTTLNGQPWFGRAVYELLDEADKTLVDQRPAQNAHTLRELIWHMHTWAAFVLAQLQEKGPEELSAIEALDWRELKGSEHSWANGVKALKSCHAEIINLLGTKDDALLKEMVPGRRYNFRFMLNGLIQHNIYHAGQVAQLNNWFAR